MYKIKVKNNETGIIWWEYGFSSYLMKRLDFYYNETDSAFYQIYDVLQIIPIIFTLDTFRKCLFNETKIIKR
jgi:hypothetical protein